jgi:hypothetical protein
MGRQRNDEASRPAPRARARTARRANARQGKKGRATLERRRLAPNPLATLNQLTTPVIFPPESAPSAGSADGFSPSPSGGADASFTESAASSLANASPFPPLIVE